MMNATVRPRKARTVLLVAAGAVAAAVIWPFFGAVAEARERTTLSAHWAFPYPFAGAPGGLLGGELRGPRASIDAPVGAGSLYQIRRLRWGRWGRSPVTARGRARYCSDRCDSWRSITIVLSRRRSVICGDSASQYEYTRYRLSGFAYISSSRTFRSMPSTC